MMTAEIKTPLRAKDKVLSMLSETEWMTRGDLMRADRQPRVPDTWIIALFELYYDGVVDIRKTPAHNREGFVWEYKLKPKVS